MGISDRSRSNGWRMRLRRGGVILALLLGLGALPPVAPPAYGVRTNANETPQGFRATLFQPCEFELGDVSGDFSLNDLADSQHYRYVELSDTAATLDSFASLNAARKAGIIEIATHGSATRLLIECYPPTPAGKQRRNARLSRLCTRGRPAGRGPAELSR